MLTSQHHNRIPSDQTILGRVLIVDDDRALHDDYQRTLAPEIVDQTEFDKISSDLFGSPPSPKQKSKTSNLELVHAFQGEEGLALVTQSVAENQRFALAFVDVIMPPGWDGVETTRRLWEVDPDIQVVICTAYSDFSWQETIDRIGRSQGLQLLRKPFDPEHVVRFAETLCQKWRRCHKPIHPRKSATQR